MIIPLSLWVTATGQHHPDDAQTVLPLIADIEAQPLLAHSARLNEALSFLGSALADRDVLRLQELKKMPHSASLTKEIQEILDPYCLAMVDINPEARVKVIRGPAAAVLLQDGWKSFLIKVRNDAGVTAKLEVESPNAAPLLYISSNEPVVQKENILTRGQVENRFLEMSLYRNRPLQPDLSGLELEYAVLQIYCKDAGKREAELSFNIGQGSQDIGFRNAIAILFHCARSVKTIFRIKDDDGSPAMASFIIKDGIERLLVTGSEKPSGDYRVSMAQTENRVLNKRLRGIYPLPSRRAGAYDEYPDFFFQPQVYRSDGEYVQLAPGKYEVEFTRGPEYITQHKQIIIPSNATTFEVSFQLRRWINMAALGWYSADHHVHAAGCSHYESPEEGVNPGDMWRQIVGEDLNIGAVLAWGPSWYHQKKFFTGKISSLSTTKNIMRNDVEVSGFPSSHAGHVVLLGLTEDDYPGADSIQSWPSWTLPVLQWAHTQGAATGYAHSGWGLEPITPSKDIFNYRLPKMDGIGANEYIVTVAHKAIDFYSAGDTPPSWELNMWYHSLNCGFRVRLSGETDFPCIFDERVGIARTYYKSDSVLNFNNYLDAVRKGCSYVSDGSSHITDVEINTIKAFTDNSEVNLKTPQIINIAAKVAANLSAIQSEEARDIAARPADEQPYWSLERARIGSTRKTPVELIVNGEPVDTINIVADGDWKKLNFKYQLAASGWVALRIYPSVHTNPVFVIIDNKPICIRKSADWCRKAVDQCWKMKEANIRKDEKEAAESAYNKARDIYNAMIKESSAY